MAQIVKTTNVLNINLLDSTGAVTTWKLNDPQTGLSLATVTSNLNLTLGTIALVCNSAGYDLISLKSAEYETVVKTTEQLT